MSGETTIPVPNEIGPLIRRFGRNLDDYKSVRYNETQLRREFLDPFFKALGWDIDNEHGWAEAYKDVIHEDSIKVPGVVGGAKAPDYCFRIGGARKFFVEAKKPSVDLRGDPAPAYQVRRYAYSAKLPLSILTDFEEFAIYDCRVKPDKNDRSSTSRVLYLTYDEYEDRWGEIASIFSREAVLQGSFDRFAESTGKKRGTGEVDSEFLKEIESWRDALARNIVLRNTVTSRQVNHAVQVTIDRIVFLRICEDRGVEEYGRLQALLNDERIYERLFELFHAADKRYNSGLFHFDPERGRPGLDELTPSLSIDDKPLKDIIRRLYYPDCPYEFSVLPAEILGHVYEQFLEKVIEVTPGGKRVRIEEKPEVRKAGGVYYTPTYIVEYIVKHTVGRLLEGGALKWVGKKNKQNVDQPRLDRTLRVLDPACGSGSFVLGAYQCLLDWHRDWYTNDDPKSWARRKKPPIYQIPSPAGRGKGEGEVGDWRLTVAERKRILVEHIFGVDIDSQAVEVTKLSLLLKVLEGETAKSLGAHLWFEKERALPDLSNNIKCGNSLIGSDFWKGKQQDIFDEEERYRINAFDWKREFPQVFRDGGFDAVIGNPPYLSFSGRQAIDISSREKEYYSNYYYSGGWPTSHGLFLQRAARDLASRMTGHVVPDQVGHLHGYQPVRNALAEQTELLEVRYWGEGVFAGVTTPVLTVMTDRQHSGPVRIVFTDGSTFELQPTAGVSWTCSCDHGILANMRQRGRSLDAMVADPGVHTGNCSKKLILPLSASDDNLVAILEGKQVSRYRCDPPNKGLKLEYVAKHPEYFTIRVKDRYTKAQFIIRQTASHPIVGPRDHADYFRNSLLALYPPPAPLDVRFFVGVLNSRLLRFYYISTVHESGQKAFPQVKVRALRELPVYWPNMDDTSELERHERLVNIVQRMLDLHKRLPETKILYDRTVLLREIDATDRAIDELVYELYGLSEEEIRIVEEGTDG